MTTTMTKSEITQEIMAQGTANYIRICLGISPTANIEKALMRLKKADLLEMLITIENRTETTETDRTCPTKYIIASHNVLLHASGASGASVYIFPATDEIFCEHCTPRHSPGNDLLELYRSCQSGKGGNGYTPTQDELLAWYDENFADNDIVTINADCA